LKFPFKLRQADRPSHGQMAVRDRFADIRARIHTDSPLIVDGGAHTGSMIGLFRLQYRSPVIYAFEPIPELAATLRQRHSVESNMHVYDKALGAESKRVQFNILNYAGSSSLLSPADMNRRYHGSKMDISRTIEVDQVRLDEILPHQEIDILKLDLQGGELEALNGCGAMLDRIKTITTEVEFVPLYEGQPLFADIDGLLRENGFQLLNLYELYTQADGQLTAGDAVYLNRRYFG
jgi:FkbM family methyltransferase